MAGILPFGAVFIELFFIFNALWENQFYYLFGFLFLVFCILVVSVSQISIVMVYFQLCGEVMRMFLIILICDFWNIIFDYHWICIYLDFLWFTGLSLVVEEFYRLRRFCCVYFNIFHILFFHKIGNNRVYTNTALYWIHR